VKKCSSLSIINALLFSHLQGFGFLMTFPRRYAHSAVALNMAASALSILLSVLTIGWFQQGLGVIEIDLPLLIDAAFSSGAAMISFGAVLGKVTPAQITWLVALQAPIYALNAYLVTETLGAIDVGGSITIHAFGAFYGLAASWWHSSPGSGSDNKKAGASYVSDLTAMIGTIFLFIYWPSFNSALAAAASKHALHAAPRALCVMNTVVALLGATLAAFAASVAVGGKLNMVHIQNATLAGGVAIGSSANLDISPAAALGVGLAAGLMSVIGYAYISPAVERALGVTDTCGVLNLHGCPGILGGLMSAVFSIAYFHSNKKDLTKGWLQPVYQVMGLALTLAMAGIGGWAAGMVSTKLDAAGESLKVEEMYEDKVFWTEEGEEED
jgi:ammonium transporter Rh